MKPNDPLKLFSKTYITEEENTLSVKVGFEINIVEFKFINMKFYIARFFGFIYDAVIFIGCLFIVSILYTSIALFGNIKFIPYLNFFLSLLLFFFYIYLSLLTKKQTIGMKAWDLKINFETKNLKLSILIRLILIFFTILFPFLLFFKLLNKEFLHDSISKSKIYSY